ncbi:MAG: preprotein translocase subunit SecA [Thermotogae bacterium]|nr:preprotein translocase subunit SecA [Thermotogota bacterium]
MANKLLRKIIPSYNDRQIRRYSRIVEQVNKLEPKFEKVPDEYFAQRTAEFRNMVQEGTPLEEIMVEAYAMVREVAKRTLKERPFDVQIMGAIALHEGKCVEMKTGEGKTLVATMPVYLNALEGKGVHVVTVNDYLARRDAAWMGGIYEMLGLTVGVIQNGMEFSERKVAYNADVTYGTNNEFGFDYLRDNMAYSVDQRVQRGHHYAIVDEVDSILIDEARTPLIISGPAEDASALYRRFSSMARGFKKGKDFEIDEKSRTVSLTSEGVNRAEKSLRVKNLYDPSNVDYLYHLLNALKAFNLFKRDVDYLVKDGEIVIVDEFTGRLLPGRRYSEGLHQAIEAKEGVKVRSESLTYATITFQNYFRMYDKLAGMTGTAETEKEEFDQIYNMKVVVIPTNKPVIRKDMDDLVYRTRREKFNAIVEDIVERHEKGQPILVGTISIEKNEMISNLLKKRHIPHEVLNAKYHEREAEIIAKAGQPGAVTVATNMAGRGTDIKLGEGVVDLGGLYVLGTERHESRRIDNQLRGRSGRQGDPGESRFYLSLEDDLIRIFGGEKIGSIMNVLKLKEGEPIEHPMLSRLIESAQKKVEGINFAIRKNLLELDDVLGKQREAIYSHRNWILENDEVDSHVHDILTDVIERRVETFIPNGMHRDEWPLEDILNALKPFIPFAVEAKDVKASTTLELKEELGNLATQLYEEKKKDIGEEFENIQKYIILRVIDESWRRHLESMESLKGYVNLRAYGNRDPVLEFKKESFGLFEDMIDNIYDTIATFLFRVKVVDQKKVEEKAAEEMNSAQYVHNEYSSLGRKQRRRIERVQKKHSGRLKVKR